MKSSGAPAKAQERGKDKPDAELIGFLLEPNFAMMGFAAGIEPLRQANRLSGKELYRWRLVSADGKPIQASNGIALTPDHSLADGTGFDAVYVCGGLDSPTLRDRAVFAWLNRLARHGCRIGSLSGGTYALARAGLLTGYRACIHWEYLQPFREEFP